MNATLPGARALDDALNPILVKEVRQSLRGRYFRGLFWTTLAVATLIGLSVVAETGLRTGFVEVGKSFFLVMFGCLCAAVCGFTPFSCFLSTGAEWEENTHDLLVLSNLRPRQIVYGKLLSALIQAALYYSTFGPFLVFAFLLNGVDLRVIGVLLAVSVALCVALSLLGIALASLSPAKAPRMLLMALFGVGLMFVWSLSLSFAAMLVDRPQTLREPMAMTMLAGFVCGALLVGAFFAAIAVARLSHEEENRSTGLRVLATVLTPLAAAWGAWIHSQFGAREAIWGLQIAVLVPLALEWLFSTTEAEPLGRHVARHVSRNPVLALASAPFLPGGGRGVLLMGLQTLTALAGSAAALALRPTPSAQVQQTLGAVAALHVYAWLYIAAPAALASAIVRSERGRIVARMLIAVAFPVTLLAPPLLGLLLGVGGLKSFVHPLNPAWAVVEIMDRQSPPGFELSLLWLAGTLAVLLNAPRAVQGCAEVLRASAARRAPPSRTIGGA